MVESLPTETLLPERLHRTRRKSEPGCALVLGIVFTLAAGSCAVIVGLVEREDSPWPYWGLCAAAGLVGLLLLWSWFVQMLTARIPPAIVEISEYPLVVGSRIRICVRQIGPATCKSLRTNLVCLRQELKRVRAGASTKTWVDKQIYGQNLIHAKDVRALSGNEWNEMTEFDVPVDQPTSMNGPKQRIKWRIEVWLRVGAAVGKMHSFDVNVTDPITE